MGSKGGKIPAIPTETRDAMQVMRDAGKTIKDIAEFYHVSQNSVLKYTVGVSDTPDPSGDELDTDVEDMIAGQHAKRVLNQSKKIDADTVHAGEALREYFKTKGLDVDLRKIPFDQLIKLVKSPGVYEGMNSDVKDVFNEWLMERVNKTDAVTEKQDGKMNFNDIKEILMLKFLMKMAGDDSSDKGSDQINQLISENEKLRQEFRDEIEKNRQEMKELVLEKRLQTMDDTHMETVSSLSGQLNDLMVKLETLKSALPVGGSPAQKTALEELSDAVSQINRVKGSLAALGVIPVAPGAPGVPSINYQNTDGTTDYIRYAGDKLSEISKTIADAYSKKSPDRKQVAETPPVSDPGLTVVQAEQLYQQFVGKPSLTPAETDWINGYLPIRAQYYPSARETVPYAEPVSSGPVEVPASLPAETPNEPVIPIEPVEPMKTVGILDRMRLEEDHRTKTLDGVL